MTQDAWNPQQYERFRSERSQPFYDLLSLVRPAPNMRVVDLGCGTGDLTRVLHERLRARATLGVDSSASMLAKSAALAGARLGFEQGDITAFAAHAATAPPAYELVFSNAALHWVPDHPALLTRLSAALTEGGQLAVQVPANFDHPAHTVASEVAAESPFKEALSGYVRAKPILHPEEYAVLLDRLGYREQHVRLQVYGHRLASRDEVIEWVKGTLLTDYQRRLPSDLSARFLARYRECLLPRLEDTRPYFYPFKRVLFWARR